MNSVILRLYAGRTISSFGSWITFLAVALLINEKYGSNHVAFSFLIQSIPPLLISSKVSRWVPTRHHYGVYLGCLVASAINVALLILNLGLWQIYAYLVTGSLINAFANPLSNSLIGQWVQRDELAVVHSRLGAINASILGLAPPLGGFISAALGFNVLFILDAASFLIAALLLLPKPADCTKSAGEVSRPLLAQQRHILTEKELNSPAKGSLWTWYWFLAIGAIFNALEFAAFKNHGFDKETVGLILGAWGVGNLTALVLGVRLTRNIQPIFYAFALCFTFTIFLISANATVAVVSFLIAGVANAVVSGKLKAQIQTAIEEDVNTLSVWTLVNKRMCLVNVIFFGLIGAMLPHVSWTVWVGLLMLASTGFLFHMPRGEYAKAR